MPEEFAAARALGLITGYPSPAMSLEARIITVGEQIAKIARRLPALGYQFRRPSAVFPGPEPGTENAIDRIEREAGELPLALKTFWRLVGSVDFTAHYKTSWPVEYPWPGCDYPDPLVVYPPSAAVAELDDFLGDREERMRCKFPYVVPIAPDDAHKDNVSGGMWYNLSVPALAKDPPLNDERHQTTFVNYLELAVRWGGFPGLERCPKHGWPLHQLAGTPIPARQRTLTTRASTHVPRSNAPSVACGFADQPARKSNRHPLHLTPNATPPITNNLLPVADAESSQTSPPCAPTSLRPAAGIWGSE